MSFKWNMEDNFTQHTITSHVDGLLLRHKFSDILDGRVNNNDMVDILRGSQYNYKHEIENVTGEIKMVDAQFLKSSWRKSIPSSLFTSAKPKVYNKEELSEKVSDQNLYSMLGADDPHSIRQIYQQINMLKYRERAFVAAGRLSKGMKPFSEKYYKEPESTSKIIEINVGGRIFEVFESTCLNISNTKLYKCMSNHKYGEDIFIDRDPTCFNSVLNFYRTGKLHAPPNICLTFFEDELSFWGVNESFLEPCCWSDFQIYKSASDKLKVYSEDVEKHKRFIDRDDHFKCKYRKTVYTMITSSNSITSRWISIITSTLIIVGIFCMILETTPVGRIDLSTNKMAQDFPDEPVSVFLDKTKVNPNIEMIEMFICGFFCFDILSRLFLCPSKMEFFSDFLNWVDIIATFTSIIGTTSVMDSPHQNLEAYILILKLPRLLRLFRLTPSLRSGMGAFTLTIKACIKELKFVFLFILTATVVFGIMIFSAEFSRSEVNIVNIYIGMWWAIVSMSGVGYGEYVPKSSFGYIIGALCIATGVVVCQMPFPILLKNFSVYYSQASARLVSQSKLLLFENVDKRGIRLIEDDLRKQDLLQKSPASSRKLK